MLKAGLVSLVLAYMLSQFYRAFLAVLAPVLQDQVGAGPGDLALSSGLWFIAFALMQLPVGAALDRFGPRRTVAWLMAVGGAGGAVIFAMADAPWHLHLAMTALGIGCSPALMGPYFIFAREYPPASFGMLAGVLVGFGSLGNILGASPLVWVIEAAGWRQTLWGLAAVTLMVAALVLAAVRDPARLGAGHPQGSIGQILRLRALWFIVPLFGVNYAVTAAIRGLWAAPWLEQVHGADATQIGRVTLAMGLAMVAGSFAVGPAARLAGSARRATMLFSAVMIVTLAVMWQAPALPLPTVTALLVVLGFFGSAYPLADGAWTIVPATTSGGTRDDLPQHDLHRWGRGDAVRVAPGLCRGTGCLCARAGLRYAVAVLPDPAGDRVPAVFPDARGRRP